MAAKVWSAGRKWMGNLIPALFCVPFGVVGVITYDPARGLSGVTLALLVAFPVVGWLALNLFGLYQNYEMQSQISRLYDRTHTPQRLERYFVGFARPKHRSALDPHEDVGFLIVHPDSLEFFGETLRIELERRHAQRVRFRANPHTWLGLGRFVSVEGEVEAQPIRFMFEPRVRPTLLGNMLETRKLRARMETWLKGDEPQADGA